MMKLLASAKQSIRFFGGWDRWHDMADVEVWNVIDSQQNMIDTTVIMKKNKSLKSLKNGRLLSFNYTTIHSIQK